MREMQIGKTTESAVDFFRVAASGADFTEVQAAVDALAASEQGGRVVIAPGIYREPVRVTRGGIKGSPIRIEAESPGTVVFSGADPLDGWTLVGANLWRVPFILRSEERLREFFGVITLPIQIWMDDRRLDLSDTVDALAPYTFAYDGACLWMRLEDGVDPFQNCVEVAVREEMLTVEADYVSICGLTVTRCGVSIQNTGASLSGDHLEVQQCVFSETAGGVGVKFKGTGLKVRRNHIHHNGQMGFAFLGVDSVFEENYVHHNDLRNFQGHPDAAWHVWESGGGKVAFTRNSVFRRNRFVDNRRGPGLWLDIDNYHNRIESNYFARNGHSSIMIEISYDNLVCNNIILDTLQANYAGAGILVQLSCRTRIYHNLICRSAGYGVHLRWHVRQRDIHPYEPADPEAFAAEHGFRQEDWMPPDGDYPVRGNDVRNNAIVDCAGGSLYIDFHKSLTGENTSDYNLHWNRHSLHPMSGGHRLLEWQELTGLDLHSLYTKEMHYGPLFLDPENGDFRPHPDGPLAQRVPQIVGVESDFAGEPRLAETTAGPFEAPRS
jgi:hypothetical protein